MLEEAILDAKAAASARDRRRLSRRRSRRRADHAARRYVPDLDLRMGLYRRMNELESRQEIEAFAAELIDRFGKLPVATEKPPQDHRDQAQLPQGRDCEAGRRREGRARPLPRGQILES
jgi:hypothetical protein